jgi:predicted dehydrogenase
MTLRVACVGAGYFSQFHIGSWLRMPRATLVGVCDVDIAKAEATGLPAFGDLSRMLAEVRPDVLDIILPPAAHVEAIRTAVATGGITAIICQKPFCERLEDAEAMIALADQAGIPLIVHENFRFQPWYRKIKDVLDAGTIGQVYQATFRLRPGDGQGPEAYLSRQPYFQKMEKFLIHETCVHWVDTFRYLFGSPRYVYADLRRVNPVIAGEDAGYVIFDHPGGVRALFDGNRGLDHAADNTRRTMGEALIEGSEGVLSLTGDGAVALRRFGAIESEVILPPDTHDGFGGDCTHALQSHVISGLIDQAPLENLAADYLGVIKTEQAIYRSAKEHRKMKV